MTQNKVRNMTLTAVFAALLCIFSQISIPLGFVPITLQTAAVYIIALTLGPGLGTVTVVIYLLLGAVGLPVFHGATGGIGILLGPTGGFLWGFLLVPLISGMLINKMKRDKIISYMIALLPGFFVVFALGLLWLKYSLALAWGPALMAGVVPYIPGDLAKIVLAAFVARRIYHSGLGYGAK